MDLSHRFIALPLALALSAGAFAADESSPAVEKLKSSLSSTIGFQVDTERQGSDGASCIVYRVENDNGGSTKAHAVVQGDKVLNSTSRSRAFEKAWNSNCAKG
jgi:hypothetical protein